MRAPLVVVTGGIAAGKSTVARVLAERGGAYVDADALAHRALDEPDCRRGLRRALGAGVFGKHGRLSRPRLAEAVFSDQEKLEALNRIVRPYVKRFVGERIAALRPAADYIVLDAVLFFQYRFRFKADLVVLVRAPEQVRVRRLMRRDGLTRRQALERIERQRDLHEHWERADVVIETDAPPAHVRREAARVRDEFLDRARGFRRRR